MKKIALAFNSLLLGLMTFIIVSEGAPGGPDAVLFWMIAATLVTTVFAFRDHFFSSPQEERPSAEGHERVAAAPERQRPEKRDERKPLYEWIETVEERLDAMETARTERTARDVGA
jgi:hypothetical protein